MADEVPEFDLFHALAAMNQFRALKVAAPEFYQKHFHSIELGTAGVRWWASHSPEVQQAFSRAVVVHMEEATDLVRSALRQYPLSGEPFERALAQLRQCLPALHRAAQDPDLPVSLMNAKMVIDYFFEG
jgi:hypothetical protein